MADGEFLFKTIVATLVSAVVAYLTITPLIALVKRAKLWLFGSTSGSWPGATSPGSS